ncbi:hypothetical protein SNE40_019487 [Patella caerulea]|uniref:N-acylethanolamine-hydrolyzing acid amidase n=1 Tax=Patella caerulea TaxID=87958 RepID=A0AAN8J8M0_PATCE
MTLTNFFLGLLLIISVSSDTPTTPGRYSVNLDLPAMQRWNDVVPRYKEAVKDMHDLLENLFDDALAVVDFVATELDQYIPQPYADEMRGISLALNMSLGEVVMSNLLFELGGACTSIVLEDANGVIWHARNLDFPLFSSKLRDIVILVDFQRGGKTVYSAATFAGYVGIISGQKPSAYSITVNTRNIGNVLLTALEAFLNRKSKPMAFLVRDTLDKVQTFTQAVQSLSNTDTEAEGYLAVAGISGNEAVVVTKDRVEADNLWYINATQGHWFDVQTNFDHWERPPYEDMNKTILATEALNKLGRSAISVNSLFKVLSTKHVLNRGTVYSVVMNPAVPGDMKIEVRHP